MNRLLDMGFIRVGYWSLTDGNLQLNLTSHHTATNVLYAFVADGEVRYIGKTKTQLVQRMYGYQRPGPTQSTNVRNKTAISQYLQQQQDQTVDILALVDHGLLRYGSFAINLAAGLEDAMIYEINPEWNVAGRSTTTVDTNSENPDLTQETMPTGDMIPVLATAQIIIGATYKTKPFFNIGVLYSDQLAPDGVSIEIQLGTSGRHSIAGYINRTANQNATPRIIGGRAMTNWISNHFEIGATMHVDILSPTSIRLR